MIVLLPRWMCESKNILIWRTTAFFDQGCDKLHLLMTATGKNYFQAASG